MTLADAGYFAASHLAECARRGQKVVVSEARQRFLKGPYHKDRFTYDEHSDSFRCPQGHSLTAADAVLLGQVHGQAGEAEGPRPQDPGSVPVPLRVGSGTGAGGQAGWRGTLGRHARGGGHRRWCDALPLAGHVCGRFAFQQSRSAMCAYWQLLIAVCPQHFFAGRFPTIRRISSTDNARSPCKRKYWASLPGRTLQ